jgi:hypothetical protein
VSYQITLTNGNILTTVPDTQLVSTFGDLDLIGKNYAGFGTTFNNDLVHMVEHFADSTPPTNPFIGQIWYDTVSNAINFWNGTQFKSISVITSSPTPPLAPQEGDEWYDSVNQQLNIWNGFEWVLVGPPNQGGAKEGFVVASIQSNTGNIFYLQLYANNNLLGIVSGVNLTNPDIVGFGNIRVGWNFVTNPESAPAILESGIYNVSKITLGNSDQLGFLTDGNDNAIIQVNSGNVMIATNGNGASNIAAYTEWANGNIEGVVYFDKIVAGSYGNLPASAATPGLNTQVIYNNFGNLAGTSALTIASSTVTADNLDVNGILVVTGNVVGNLNLTNSLNASGVVATDITASVYHNLPPFSVPGSTGEVLFNNGGTVGASAALVIESGIVGVNQLSVNAGAQVGTTLQVGTSLVVGTTAQVDGNLAVEGQTTLNSGTGGQFTMPTNSGSVGNPLISNGDGTTQWSSTANLALIASGTSGGNYWERSATGKFTMWGTVTTDINAGTLSVSFPRSFNTLSTIVVTVTTKSPTDRITFVVDGSVTTSGFIISNNGSSGFAYWHADGY